MTSHIKRSVTARVRSAVDGTEEENPLPVRLAGGQAPPGYPSYDDKQAGARLSQCIGCGLWFWFTKQPAPDYCVKCRRERA